MDTITDIIADGLDAAVDGRGWNKRHEKARCMANASRKMLAALKTARDELEVYDASAGGEDEDTARALAVVRDAIAATKLV